MPHIFNSTCGKFHRVWHGNVKYFHNLLHSEFETQQINRQKNITIQNKKKILCPSTNYKQNQNISIYMKYG